MKRTIIILTALALLSGGQVAMAQRNFGGGGNFGGGFGGPDAGGGNYDPGNYGRGNFGGGRNARTRTTFNQRGTSAIDPRIATNGFDIININNIFNPSRRWTMPVPIVPVIPTYTITLDGVLTSPSGRYAFLSGSAVSAERPYTISNTFAEFQITDITNNTVLVVDTNNQKTYTLNLQSTFYKRGTNEWQFQAAPEAVLATVDVTGGDTGGLGPMSDTMRKLIERRRKEMGEDTPAAPATDPNAPVPPDAPAPPPPADAPAPPPPPGAPTPMNSPDSTVNPATPVIIAPGLPNGAPTTITVPALPNGAPNQ